MDGVFVHVGAPSLFEAWSWRCVPEDGDGVGEPNKDDGVTLGDFMEASIWAKGTDSEG